MTEKLQCARCGSRRQRNLQRDVTGQVLCKRCAHGFAVPKGSKQYRYTCVEQVRDVTDIDDPAYDTAAEIANKERVRRWDERRSSPRAVSGDEPDWQAKKDRRTADRLAFRYGRYG